MANKTIKMVVSERAHKKYKRVMKLMGFKNESQFLMYCVMKAVRPKVTNIQKKQMSQEMKELKAAQK